MVVVLLLRVGGGGGWGVDMVEEQLLASAGACWLGSRHICVYICCAVCVTCSCAVQPTVHPKGKVAKGGLE